MRTRGETFYDVILVNFMNGTESLLRRVASQAEADLLLAELQKHNRQPSNYFYWVARAAGMV
ncbi:MAG: hypothetical protein ACE15B_11405 [Bryobacteraceae bacterium]